MKNIIISFVVGLVIGALAMAFYPSPPPSVPAPVLVKGKTDTVFVTNTKILRISVPAKVARDTNVVYAETTVVSGKDSAHIKVEYDKKMSKFDIAADLFGHETTISRTDTLTVYIPVPYEKPRQWYNKIHVGVGAGLIYVGDKISAVPTVALIYEVL